MGDHPGPRDGELSVERVTPLMGASLLGRVDDVRRLLPDADVDEALPNGFTALMFAAAAEPAAPEHADIVRMLLAAGADPDPRTSSGESALWFAAERGSADIVALLLAAGAAADVVAGNGSTALHVAAFVDDARSVAALIAAGCPVNARMHDGTDALMCAAQEGALASVELLLAAGADPHAVNDRGATARILAALRDHAEVLRRL